MVRNKAKVGGIMMTVAAIGGFVCISIFYLLPGVLLLIGGLMVISVKIKLLYLLKRNKLNLLVEL